MTAAGAEGQQYYTPSPDVVSIVKMPIPTYLGEIPSLDLRDCFFLTKLEPKVSDSDNWFSLLSCCRLILNRSKSFESKPSEPHSSSSSMLELAEPCRYKNCSCLLDVAESWESMLSCRTPF